MDGAEVFGAALVVPQFRPTLYQKVIEPFLVLLSLPGVVRRFLNLLPGNGSKDIEIRILLQAAIRLGLDLVGLLLSLNSKALSVFLLGSRTNRLAPN